MKFNANVAELKAAMRTAGKVVESRSTIPILQFVHLNACGDKLTLRTTNLDIELALTVAAKIAEPGNTCVDADLLNSVLRKLPEKGEIVFTDNDAGYKATLKCGRARFTLNTLAPEDFPTLMPPTSNHTFDVPVADLLKLTSTTEFAISNEESRYYLGGIYLHVREQRKGQKVLAAVSTDGHRLASAEVPLPDGADGFPAVIIHKGTVKLLADALEGSDTVEMTIADNRIGLRTDTMTLYSKVIDGTFPDYDRVVPTGNDKLLRVETKSLAEAADRVSTVSSERGRCVRLDIDPGSVKLSVVNPDIGASEEAVEAEYESESLTTGFNARYLADILANVQTETVDLHLADPGSPALIVPQGDDSRFFVLMPMLVN